MVERTHEQILDQLVYAVACAYKHYGPELSAEGLVDLRQKLGDHWFTDSGYTCDVYDDDPYVDFYARIIQPSGWKVLDFKETINLSKGLDADGY